MTMNYSIAALHFLLISTSILFMSQHFGNFLFDFTLLARFILIPKDKERIRTSFLLTLMIQHPENRRLL